MILEYLEISNVLSHRLTRVKLPEGVIVVVGPNGAGKSSLVDAISYALFGVHSRGGGRRGEREPLIRLGSSSSRITIEFKVDGRRYRLLKVFGRSTPTRASLYVLDGSWKTLATSVRSVEAELARIMGVDPGLAAELFIVHQGEVERLLLDRDRRLKVFNAMLGIKKMEKAHRELGTLIKLLERELRLKKSLLNEALTHLSRLRKARSELERLEEEKRLLESRLKELAGELAGREAVEREYNEVSRETARLEAAVGSLRSELERLEEEAVRLEAELKEIEDTIRESPAASLPLEEILGKLDEAVELAARLASTREEISRGMRELEELEEKLKEYSSLASLAREYEELQKRMTSLEEAARRYEVARRWLEEKRKRISLLEERKRKIILTLRQTSAPVLGTEGIDYTRPAKVRERIEWLLHMIDESIRQLEARRENTAREVAWIEKRIRDMSDNLERLSSAQGVCPLCGKPLSEEERLQLIRKLSREKREAEGLLAQRRSILNRVTREIEEYKGKLKLLHRFQSEAVRLIAQLEQLASEEEQLKSELSKLNDEYLKLYVMYQEYENARRRLDELGKAYSKYMEKPIIEAQLRKAREKLKALEKEEHSLRDRLRSLLEDIGLDVGFEEDPQKLSEKLSDMLQSLYRLRETKSRYEVLKERLIHVRERISLLRERIGEAESELQEKRERLKELSSKLSWLKAREKEASMLREEYARITGRITVLREEVERLKPYEDRAERLKNVVGRVEKAIMGLERIRKALDPRRGLPRIVRQKSKALMEAYLRSILERFNIDFVDVQLDDDYDVILYSSNGAREFRMLSGGERIALAIAYRLALARTASQRVETLILDEPTIHLDEERRRELINIIRYSLAAANLSQIIIVTHDPEVEEAADYVIEVRRKGDVSIVEAREPAVLPAAREAPG
ncbi:MAG: hypothetical protein DSY37_03255 [Hyperthermus sp.]|nr:MAG: hypothetical protein DSY37_03255 [Hyperthermus sp.]